MKIESANIPFKIESGRTIYVNSFDVMYAYELMEKVKNIIKLDWPVRFLDPNLDVEESSWEKNSLLSMKASNAIVLHLNQRGFIPYQLFTFGLLSGKNFFIVSEYEPLYLNTYVEMIGNDKIVVCSDMDDLSKKISEWLTKELVENVTISAGVKATPRTHRF